MEGWNKYHEVAEAHSVKAYGPSRPTNEYYGSSRIHTRDHVEVKAEKGDQIHTFGGETRYLVKKNGDVHQMPTHEKKDSAFERGKGAAIKLDASKTKEIDASKIHQTKERNSAGQSNYHGAAERTEKAAGEKAAKMKAWAGKKSDQAAGKKSEVSRVADEKSRAAVREGTYGAHVKAAEAHGIAADNTKGATSKGHRDAAAHHEGKADEIRRDEQGRFAPK